MMLEKASGNDSKMEKFGQNVSANFLYLRHTEKSSGSVGSGTQVSMSGISSRGQEQAVQLGHSLSKLSPPKSALKIRHSEIMRTYESAKAIEAGYTSEAGLSTDEYEPRKKTELSDRSPEGFRSLYMAKWDAIKIELMRDRGLLSNNFDAIPLKDQSSAAKKSFDSLPSKEQADIAEISEESLMEEWLNNPDGELARLYPSEQAAARTASLVRRDLNTAQRLRSGSEQNFLSDTHKWIMEPLLMRIIKLPEEKKPEKLEDIGGSLGLNDGWELRVKTDGNGTPNVSLYTYRTDRNLDDPEYAQTQYDIDLDELNRLADMGVKLASERRKKEIAENPELWNIKEN